MEDPALSIAGMNGTSSWWSPDGVGMTAAGNMTGSSNTTADLVGSMADVFHPEGVDPAFVRFRDESRFWIQRVLLPIIGTIGVFGNVVTILVLTRRGMRTSTNAYLTALAVADLVYLICVFWLSLRHYPNVKEDPVWSSIYAHVWPYSLWLTDATTNTSVWLTVTFTVERYIAVAHPIRGRMLCTESRAKKVIIGVYVVCFTAALTTPFEWTVVEVTDPLTNISKVEIAPSHLGNDETYQSIYYWFTSITFVLLPLSLLIIFNSFLIQSVRQSQKLRQIMTARQSVSDREERAATNEIKITTILIAVVIMFLVCQLPTAATLIYKIFHEPKPQSNEEAVLRALGNIFNCLVSLNAACNFLLYCALSDKYRRVFMWTFCRCLYRPASPVHSMACFTQIEGVHSTAFSRQMSVRMMDGQHPNHFRRSSSASRYSTSNGGHPVILRSASQHSRNNIYLSLPTGPGDASPRRMVSSSNNPSPVRRLAPMSPHRNSPSVISSPQSRVSVVITSNKGGVDPSSGSSAKRWHQTCWPWRRPALAKPGPASSLAKAESILIHVSAVGDAEDEAGRLQERGNAQQVDREDEVAFV